MAGGGCRVGAGAGWPHVATAACVVFEPVLRRTATRRLSVFVSPLVFIIEKNKGGGEEQGEYILKNKK